MPTICRISCDYHITLYYSSEPKGVMITHNNLAHNALITLRELKTNTDTVNVSWLPQYHDMGLIGSYLGLLYCGGEGYYISPISFLKDPLLWLKTISKYKGTHTQSPNFGYALVTRKFKELGSDPATIARVMGKDFNISSLQHMINAAEPIDNSTVAAFFNCFSPYGLTSSEVVVPTYGLAESTVFVCSGGKQTVVVDKAALERGVVEIISCSTSLAAGSSPVVTSTTQSIVGCGYPKNAEGVEVLIVNSETCEKSAPNQVW